MINVFFKCFFLHCLSKALATPEKSQTTHTGVVTPRLKTIGLVQWFPTAVPQHVHWCEAKRYL